jgi:hypothetical protein
MEKTPIPERDCYFLIRFGDFLDFLSLPLKEHAALKRKRL